jgi:uncharacterized membrane protein
VLLIALAILWYFAPNEVGILLLTFIGVLLVVKGFSIDKKVEEWIFPSPLNLIRLFTTIAALILIGVDSYQAYIGILENIGPQEVWPIHVVQVVGFAMKFGSNIMVLALCTFLVGIGVYFYFMHDPRIWWTVVGIVASLWMR